MINRLHTKSELTRIMSSWGFDNPLPNKGKTLWLNFAPRPDTFDYPLAAVFKSHRKGTSSNCGMWRVLMFARSECFGSDNQVNALISEAIANDNAR